MEANKQKQFLGYLKGNGGNITDALEAFNITRKEYEDHLSHDQAFREALNDIIHSANDNVRSAMYKRALEGDASAAREFSNTNQPIRVSEDDPLGLDLLKL